MSDVTIKYKGNVVADMSAEGTKTLKTSGKYCEGDIVVDYTPSTTSQVVNSKTFDITLSKSSGWVKLITLDSEVKSHINDPTFTVLLVIKSDYEYVNYAGSIFCASNTSSGRSNSYPTYGYCNRQVSETSMSSGPIYYPANHASTSTPIGGNGMFRVNGSDYYLKPGDGFIRAGDYRLVFTW